ncbi:PQQ-binding-like beta-propeller repeat protein [Kitasatospora sp. NPDC051984]|uniref:outer membrane protein assembly factor BamB family protein n=1 Tax=Kitasatospora sp. NPDC051984 TaxID=3364059 RepID=UPI0037C5190E
MVTKLWDRVLHQRGAYSKPAIANGSVLVHERHTRLVCLDLADGALKWDVPVGDWPDRPVVVGPRVLVLSQGLRCLSLATGEVLWRDEVERYTRYLAVANDVVLTGGWRGYSPLQAFDLTDGRLRWQTPGPVRTQRPVAWGDGLLLGNGSRAWLIDPRTGREQQSWQLPEPLRDAELRGLFTVLDADRCAVRCGTSSVAVLQRNSTEAELLRTHDGPLLPEAPVLADGLLWLRRQRGIGALAVDPSDGTVVHRIDVQLHLAHGVFPPAAAVTEAGTVLHPDGTTTRLGTRISAVQDLGDGRLLTLTRNSLRVYRI